MAAPRAKWPVPPLTPWHRTPRSGGFRWQRAAALLRLHFLLFLFFFLSIVVGLDGEKHERSQDDELERTEDYRDPKIHHFLKTLLQQLH